MTSVCIESETLAPAVLLNRWQRELPLVPRPYEALGERCGLSGCEVMAHLADGLASGAVSRIGAVFGIGAGGAAMLAALRVPAEQVHAVAAIVSAEPAVSHNYAREHAWNLWFVAAAPTPGALAATIDRIERATGLEALRLPMRRAYRIDLGFDLFDGDEVAPAPAGAAPAPVEASFHPLAARLEDGLTLVERPYSALGAPLGIDEAAVIDVIGRWCNSGTVRRLGAVLRHHEFGIAANAMTVFALPEAEVDDAGARLAAQRGVTLCYRRATAPKWPYNLYFMMHGRERAAVAERIEIATERAGLRGAPRAVLFSSDRFKQSASRYFSGAAT